MKKFAMIIAISAALIGCAGMEPRQPRAQVNPADEATVAKCVYLGDVQGWSFLAGLMSMTGQNQAREQAAQEAEKLGATHIVYQSASSGGSGSLATGKAYKCK
ncbi:MAG: hypothetical protein IT558_00815 [Alphaproteobacteria bacterium]|nr:hypothetical protein [Alphaproteobacteria bacterium]